MGNLEAILRSCTKMTNLKYQIKHGMKYSNYLMDPTVSDICNYFEYIIKKSETLTGRPPIKIYVNKIENRITFKIT